MIHSSENVLFQPLEHSPQWFLNNLSGNCRRHERAPASRATDSQNVGEIEGPELLRAVNTRIDLISGEKSFLNINNKPALVLSQFSQPGELLIIPEAGHHIMVDFPLQLVSAINYLLSQNT